MTWSELKSTVCSTVVVGAGADGWAWALATLGIVASMGSADHQTNLVRNAARPAVRKAQPSLCLSHRMRAATITWGVALPTQVLHPKGAQERSPFDRIASHEDQFCRPPARRRLCTGVAGSGERPVEPGVPWRCAADDDRCAGSSAFRR